MKNALPQNDYMYKWNAFLATPVEKSRRTAAYLLLKIQKVLKKEPF